MFTFLGLLPKYPAIIWLEGKTTIAMYIGLLLEESRRV